MDSMQWFVLCWRPLKDYVWTATLRSYSKLSSLSNLIVLSLCEFILLSLSRFNLLTTSARAAILGRSSNVTFKSFRSSSCTFGDLLAANLSDGLIAGFSKNNFRKSVFKYSSCAPVMTHKMIYEGEELSGTGLYWTVKQFLDWRKEW